MLNIGYIRIHRAIIESPLWKQLPAEWFKVWLAVQLRASFRPSKFWDGQKEIDIPAGSFVASLQTLANFAHVSVRQIRGALGFLKTTGEVTVQTTSRYSIITITKWDTYQNQRSPRDTQDDTPNGMVATRATAKSRHSDDTVATTEEECKERKKKRNAPPPKNGARAHSTVSAAPDYDYPILKPPQRPPDWEERDKR